MDLSAFKSSLKDIAKVSLYVVEFGNTELNTLSRGLTLIPYRAKNVTMPKDSITDIPISYYGRQIHYPGLRDTSGNQVQITFITDNNWRVYKELFKWHNDINEWLTNHNNINATDRSQYKAEMTVRLKDQTDKDTLVYKYIGVWPSDINGITLDWNENKAADFQVTFIFDYVAIVAGNGNDNIPTLATKSNVSSSATVSENESSGLLSDIYKWFTTA